MGSRVLLQTRQGIPRSVLRARVTPERPIAFHNGRYRQDYGVYTVIRRGRQRRAYFYPGQLIEEKVNARGGRDKYVYGEGFDNDQTLAQLARGIQSELPNWQPALGSAQSFPIGKFRISQPGVDMWRLLCLALDHGDQPEQAIFPPVFALRSPHLGTVLISGNHRCLLFHAIDRPLIKMVRVNFSALASTYTAALINCLEYVENLYSSGNVLALARSFSQQVERRG